MQIKWDSNEKVSEGGRVLNWSVAFIVMKRRSSCGCCDDCIRSPCGLCKFCENPKLKNRFFSRLDCDALNFTF